VPGYASFDGEPSVLTPGMLIAKDEEAPTWGEQPGEPDFYPDEIWDEGCEDRDD
jgi:hypothetical protein